MRQRKLRRSIIEFTKDDLDRLLLEGTLATAVDIIDIDSRLKRRSSQRSSHSSNLPKNRRKERVLSTVIRKVAIWRELHAGINVRNSDNTITRLEYSLDEAAFKTGISKKSLDDYML